MCDVCTCHLCVVPGVVAVNNTVQGMVSDQNTDFRKLTLVGGGILVHVGGGVALVDGLQITMSSVMAAGNTLNNNENEVRIIVKSGGILATVSSASDLVESGISVANMTVSNNTGTVVCSLWPPSMPGRASGTGTLVCVCVRAHVC